jgi:uncharacterized membrane protein YeiH
MQRFDLVRFFDTVGLALFTIIGTNAALDAGAGAISAVVVGMISGVGGGIIRDTIAERIPEVLASGHSYASAAAAGAALDVALLETSMSPAIASSIAGVAIITLRLMSIHLDWRVSRFTIDQDEDGSGSR